MYSIKQFCEFAGISLSTFKKWRREGTAPPIVKIDRRVFISKDTASAWFKSREQAA